jgi:Kef-type K+ transport system membrane component KefB
LGGIAAEVIGDIALVIAVSSLLGGVARRLGQPRVVGQLLAGVFLGSSVLGRLPGHLPNHLFSPLVLPYLNVIAQVAVIMFMFAVGYEIDFRALRCNRRAVPAVAASAFTVPMALGIICVLVDRHALAGIGNVRQGPSFLLFMGVATAITALPVLAAVVRERELAGTRAADIAVGAAGVMDVIAWLTLAAALIINRHSGALSWLLEVLATSCFTVAMIVLVPPVLNRWQRKIAAVSDSTAPTAFVLAMASSWVTASLGLHPIFGGFLAGLAMRRSNSAPDADLLRSMDQPGKLLLPLYFVVTGLSLNIGALGMQAFALFMIVFVCAVAGKVAPAYAASRIAGLVLQPQPVILSGVAA